MFVKSRYAHHGSKFFINNLVCFHRFISVILILDSGGLQSAQVKELIVVTVAVGLFKCDCLAPELRTRNEYNPGDHLEIPRSLSG